MRTVKDWDISPPILPVFLSENGSSLTLVLLSEEYESDGTLQKATAATKEKETCGISRIIAEDKDR